MKVLAIAMLAAMTAFAESAGKSKRPPRLHDVTRCPVCATNGVLAASAPAGTNGVPRYVTLTPEQKKAHRAAFLAARKPLTPYEEFKRGKRVRFPGDHRKEPDVGPHFTGGKR